MPATLIEIAAVLGYVARERAGDIPTILWAILQSDDLIDVIRTHTPDPERYAEIAELDPAVRDILGASVEGRMLLNTAQQVPPEEKQRADALHNLRSFMQSAGLVDEAGNRIGSKSRRNG